MRASRPPIPSRHIRLKGYLLFVLIVWPLLTIVGTTIDAVHFPYYTPAWPVALTASIVSLVILAPSMMLPGLVFVGLTSAIFRLAPPDSPPRSARRAVIEPLLLFASILFGAACWYPAVLDLAILWPLRALPAIAVWAILLLVILLGALTTGGARKVRLAAALVVVGVIVPVPQLIVSALWRPLSPWSDTVLLGIDSVSHADDISALRTWIAGRSGGWYERAVTPGLLTNAVWTSILTTRPVHDHGAFVTFQRFPAGQAKLLDAARAAGYRTLSVFPNQLTCAVGSEAGFDVDRSGPIGWRQIMLPPEINNTILLPLLSPALPRLPFAAVSGNLAGTFTYDIRRELRGILRAGVGDRRTLVAAHLTYLHEPDYPRWMDLSWREFLSVAMAPASRLADRSFDAMSADGPADPVQLRAWKLAHLEQVVVAEVDRAASRGTRIVMFSDHGDRVGLTPDTFADSRYHHVLLATLNLPVHDVSKPISLIAIGALAGLPLPADAEPAVEFTVPPASMWGDLFRTAHLHWNGTVELDETLLAGTLRQLRRNEPYGRGSVPVPTLPSTANP